MKHPNDSPILAAIRAALFVGLVLGVCPANSVCADEVTLKPAEMRSHDRGNIRNDGTFYFWTDGALSDYFVVTGKQIALTVVASGHTVTNEPPRLAVEIAPADGLSTRIHESGNRRMDACRLPK